MGTPVAYYGLRMLSDTAAWRAANPNHGPALRTGRLTVILVGQSNGIEPQDVQDIALGSGVHVDHTLEPLLLDDEPWPTLRPWFDQTALIVADMDILEQRNRQRWVDYEMDEEFIRTKLEDNDMPNARLVYERSAEPDWIVRT